jgi:LPXTG-site transpeptidase (sortase) family protein
MRLDTESHCDKTNMNRIRRKIGQGITTGSLMVAAGVFIRAVFFSPEVSFMGMLAPISTKVSEVFTGTKPAPMPSNDPSRLEIPAIHVNAAVQYVGQGKTGNMAVPTNFTDVGWYKLGPVPGQVGTAVIDGHVDNALALAGVFKHLDELVPGDKIQVVTNAGKTLTFKVDDIETYPDTSAPIDKIFTSDDNESHLNLITCAGDWIENAKSYNERLVVYTTLVN